MLAELCPRLRETLAKHGFTQPTPIQEKAFHYVALGVNLVISSPTGTGKTEAALIPIYDRMCRKEPGRISLVYVTPLRALNRDILRRMVRIAEELGIEAALRHGDTTQTQRRRIAENPPHMLVTTPETLQYLLLDNRYRRAFRRLRWVIVDELHELMDSKRGSELSIVLERLEEAAGHRVQRIGLSATLGDPQEAARFLGGALRSVYVVSHQGLRGLKVRVVAPGSGETPGGDLASETEARLRKLAEIIREARGRVLVFANTRDTAEFLASRLSGILGPNTVRVHHGSLSRAERLEAETLFREGRIKALIATSSMELGIDIGDVDLVIQYMSPRQASRLIQRVGRSRHRAGETARGVIVSTGALEDLLESAVIAARAMRGNVETPQIYEAPLDALAHQIAGIVLEKRRVRVEEIYRLVRRAWPYRNMGLDEVEEVVRLLDSLGVVRYRDGILSRGRRIYSYYYSVSMIPDKRSMLAVDADTRRVIGRLDADFVASRCEEGSHIVLSGRIWRIIGIEEDRVYLSAEIVSEGMLPAWEGEMIPVDRKVAREVCGLYRRLASRSLMELYPVVGEGVGRVEELLRKHLEEGHPLPSERLVYIESSGRTAVIHVCLGSRGNELLGMLVSGMLTRLHGIRVAYRATPYKVVLAGSRIDAGLVEDTLRRLAYLSVSQGLDRLAEELGRRTGMYRWRLIQVARRMGLIEPGGESRLSKPMIRHLADTLAGKEAWKEMLVDKVDLRAVEELLASLARGAVAVEARNVKELSPLARDALEQLYRFFDVVEAGLPRSLVSEITRRRLLGKILTMICLRCGYSWESRVSDLPEKISCPRCGAGFIAVARKGDREAVSLVRRALRSQKLSKEEKYRLKELREIGNLVLSYGKPVVIALSAYGIGPKTAARLTRYLKFGEEAFYAAISEAEKQFIRTRKYWGS